MKKATFCLIALASILDLGITRASSKSDSLRSLLKTSKNDTNKVKILVDLSTELVDADIYDSSIFYADQAKSLAESLNFKRGLSMSLRRIGIAYTCKSEYAASLNFLFQALKVAESIKDDYLIGKALNSIGSNYSLQKAYENSLKYFFRSLTFYYNPIVYEDIARVYHLQGKDELSIEYYNKALSYHIPEIEKSYILNDLGDIYEQRNNLDAALDYYFKSLRIAEEIQNETAICDVSGSVGDLFIKQKRYKDAIYYENRSLEIAKKINYKYGLKETELALSNIYELLGNASKSMEHYRSHILIKEEMFNEEATKQTVRAEMNFDFEKQEAIRKADQDKKDAIAKEELKQQRMQRNAFIAGMCIVIIFSIFIFRAFRRNKKAKNIIAEQKKLLEATTKEITDNIRYTKRIQDAIMPSLARVSELFPNSFIFNRGRDIVSGDFYFLEKISDDEVVFAVADSTSHGVSGSMMSMLNSNLLNEAVRNGIHTPSKILDYVNMALSRAFHQTGEEKEIKDGMDICLCNFNTKTMLLQFAGAYNPLIIVRNKEIIELDADKLQLGQSVQNYTNQEFQLCKEDMIFLSSDGFPDQFGGPKDKKYKYKNFTSLLSRISNMPIMQQHNELVEEFDQWRGNNHQTDDILVFGIKI